MNRDNRLARALPDQTSAPRAPAAPKLDRTAQTRIGDKLRSMYADLVHQPVPDRFTALLTKLHESDSVAEEAERKA